MTAAEDTTCRIAVVCLTCRDDRDRPLRVRFTCGDCRDDWVAAHDPGHQLEWRFWNDSSGVVSGVPASVQQLMRRQR